MTVAVVTPWYPEPDRPWEGTFIANPCHALRKLGVRMRVFKLTGRPPAVRVNEIDPDTGRAIAPSGILIRSSRHLASVINSGWLWSESCDVVLVEEVWTSILLRKARTPPQVVVLHGRQPMTTSGARTDPIRRSIIAASLRRASALIAVGAGILEDLPPDLRQVCTVVPNGVLLDAFPRRAVSASERVRAADFPRLVTVGNVDSNKNQETVLRAFASIRDTWPTASWSVVGDGPERRRLEGLRDQLGHHDRIRFTGRAAPAQVAAILNRSDLFVMPSRIESFGCAYLEAMAVGVPTIVPRSAGLAALIDDDRYLHDPDNGAEIVAKANAILSSPTQYEQAVAFGLALAERWTWQAHAESLADVLRKSVAVREAVPTP
ncbi:Glycosyltransferase involved in cell wall bisynthesis [Micromonospora phaseoli]|uniref:Glycosyltransferase involved in cell wall bisynthesis n=1 Tax=Micromonospora phaseoli TaxID=1144548 RepID=A0A1H6SGB4_9ACTN|nr:glycosyltransferase family 4 protein [Micromonospora phaseoli]PZW03912.1 glycosyltransferase involved in cell wall biosynthesis [Micromonospora phaseoli]SEI65916.1 Glycosyltransferase involved in cell wall bisynthesis [Micromonospora phaseoli]